MNKEEQHKSNINCLLKQYPQYESTLNLCMELLQEKYYRSQKTKDGIEIAKSKGKRIGIQKGQKIITAKSKKSKGMILKLNKSFCGCFGDVETMKYLDISRNSFYKYKKELKEEILKTSIDYCLRKYRII